MRSSRGSTTGRRSPSSIGSALFFEAAREARPVEAQAVAGEKLGEVGTLVGPRGSDVLHAVSQNSVPVSVVRAETRDILAYFAEGFAEIGRSRVVGLEAGEDLAAAKEVHRVVIEAAVFIDVIVPPAREGRVLHPLQEIVQASRLAEEVQ